MKKRRKALDLTQVELAQRIGCAVITVQKIEADRRRPSKQMAELLADQLEIPPADIQSFIRFARLNSHGRAWRDLNEPAGYTSWTLSAGHVYNLPEPLKGLFGRDQDLAEIRKRLLSDGVRLLTLIGPPGVGKTSLAINAAHCLLNEYTDGAFFISLASTIDPTFVAAIIAQFFGVNETSTQSYAQRIKEYLRDKHLLLVLDNFEQVLPASSFLNELLAECLWLSVIVTSRIPLRLRYERQFHVLPLEVPTGMQVRSDLVELTCYPAIALFLERARAARPDFTFTIENAGAIASICARLDGLPLAIEFIAAWVKVLTPQELLELIDGQWTLHIEGLSDASRRHTTLYTAIRWSYDLLSPLEQILLERLGIFSGSWTMDAAQAIMSDKLAQGSLEILNAMSKLVTSSLVVQYEHNGEARFILFEVIRFFSLEQLTKKGQENTLRQRHAEYYLALAEEADLHLRSADQLIWLSRLHIESGNLRAALTWFFEFDVNSGIRLAGALGWFWNMCSYVSEGYLWLKKALQSAGSSNPIWRTKLLTAASSLSWQQGDISTMRLFSEENIALCRGSGSVNLRDQGMAFCSMALVTFYQDDYDLAHNATEDYLALFRQAGDLWGEALALTLAGEVCLLRHDYNGACSYYAQALVIFRETGDRWAIGVVLQDWGYANFIQGDLQAARVRLEESTTLHRQVGERFSRAYSLNILAKIVQQQGNFELAASLYNDSLDLFKQIGLEAHIAEVIANLAYVVNASGHYQLAFKLYNESLSIFTRQGNVDGITQCQVGLEKARSRDISA